MDLVLEIFAAVAAAWGLMGYISFLGAPRHIGLLIDGVLYVVAGVVSFKFLIWWPLLAAFIASWILRLLGLDPGWRWPAK